MRLNKFIAESGITSRRKSEEFILQGRVTVNNKTVTDLALQVDPEKDEVSLDGEKIRPKKHLYILLNKPKGVVTTTDDEKNRRTVVDLIKTRERIFPIGRLDYDTTGVLLLTNDGDFSNLLTHPRNRVPREYEVKLDRPLLDDDKNTLLKGVFLDVKRGRFTDINYPKKDKKNVDVTGVEGRNHFVKNMFRALGYTVVSLNRKSYAGIIADVPIGQYRVLSDSEIKGVIKIYGR